MADRIRRGLRPGLERMDSRELLSGLSVVLAGYKGPTITAASRLGQRIASAGGTVQAAEAASGNNTGPTGNGFTNNASSPLLGSGTPTPHEQLREAFKARFSGLSYSSPGRFSDQGTTYYLRGVGGSNFFLHGDFNLAVVTPIDPDAPFVGVAVLNDKSTNSGGILGLILSGNRADVDGRGRPTRLAFTGDPNIYSGIFSVAAAEGTVDVKYGAKNQISVAFNGRVYTSGLTSPLVNTDFYARHNRPLRYRGPSAKPSF